MSESPVSSAGTEHDSLQSLIDGLLAANDPLGAMAATSELEVLAPDSPTPCRLRGDVYAWLRMWDAALVQYQYAMARDAEDTRARSAAATARYELGDLDSALALEPHSLRAATRSTASSPPKCSAPTTRRTCCAACPARCSWRGPAECRVRSRNTLEDFAAMLHTSLLFTSPDEEPTPRVVRVAHGSPSE
jgi:hypothetical protein